MDYNELLKIAVVDNQWYNILINSIFDLTGIRILHQPALRVKSL
jgi:hypothetical protein